MYYIGIDLGTSAVKLLLVDENGGICNEVTREFYNGESGEGLGLKRFWGWSVLAYVMPFECETGYDPSKLDGSEIQPMGKELFQMEFPASDNPRPISTQLSQDGLQ